MTKTTLSDSSKRNKNKPNLIICGVDEAGRGPVLGSLVVCGVCFLQKDLDFLRDINVKDSKKLTPSKRKELGKLVEDNCYSFHMISVDAKEIDQREEKRFSLNRLEELKMAEIVNKLKPEIIYLDAADTKEKRFGRSINQLLTYSPKKIVSKHKADDLFPIVSAASILAKNKRDALIQDLNAEFSEDIGSGYPSDQRTINFLKNYIRTHKKPPKCARKTWKTTRKILDEEIGNRKITEYFN